MVPQATGMTTTKECKSYGSDVGISWKYRCAILGNLDIKFAFIRETDR